MAVTLVSRALILDPPAPGAAPGDVQGITERISVRESGAQIFNENRNSSVSADGRFVAFESDGLVDPISDFNGLSDVYLRDRLNGDVRLVSRACREGEDANGNPVLVCPSAGGNSFEPQISTTVDGTGQVTAVQVTFESDNEDLVWVDDGDGGFAPLDNNFDTDIFQANFEVVGDVLEDQPAMTLVSVFEFDPCNPDDACFEESQYNGAFNPTVSADGTQVAFEAIDQCGECFPDPPDGIWVRNLDVNGNGIPQEPDPDPDPDPDDPVNDTLSTHVPTLFAADPDLRPGEDGFDPDLSPDGRYLVWVEDRGSTFELDLVWLYDRNLDGDAVLDEPNEDPLECTTVCVLPGNRHPDDPFPKTDIDEDNEPEYTDVGVSNSLFNVNTFDPVVVIDELDTPADVTDDEVVVAYSFCAFCDSGSDSSILDVPDFQELVVVTTFDPQVVGTRDPADPEDLLDPSTGTVVASQGLDGPEDYGDGNGSGEPSLSGDARYLAFGISDGALVALDEGQVLPAGEECFRFESSGEGPGEDHVDIPCQVVIQDRRQPELGLRLVSVGGDPRDSVNQQISLAGEPTVVGNTTDPNDFNDGDSSLPSVSGDGSVVAFETEADNLLGTDAQYYVDAPFDSNRFEDVYVREFRPLLSADSGAVDFGDVQIGNDGTATITITNGFFNSDGVLVPGFGPVTIPPGAATVTPIPGDFTIEPGGDGCSDVVLHGGESCTIVVTFAPVAPEASSGTVTLTYPHPVGGPVQIALRGTGVLPVLTGVATFQFPDAQIESDNTTETLTLTNEGIAAVTLAPGAVTVVSNGSDYFIAPGADGCSGTTIAVGASCGVDITFAPFDPGPKEATVVVNFTAGPNTFQILNSPDGTTITGDAVLPRLTAIPDPLSFGGFEVNTTGTRTITLTNVGLAEVTFDPFGEGSGTQGVVSVNLAGDEEFAIDEDACSPDDTERVLLVGQSCEVQFTFAPETPGLRSAVFTFDFRTFELVNADLNGIGVLRPPPRPRTITVTPSDLAFGLSPLGTQAASQTVTISNTGPLPVNIADVSLVGATPGDFVIVDDGCEGSLPVNQSCTIDVAGDPSTPGNKTAALLIEDDATGNPHLVGLTVSANEPILILNPGVVRPGTTTKAIGTNWVPGSIVDLSFAGDKDSLEISPESVVVGADGTFEATILVLPKREAIPRVVTATSGTIVVDENLLVTLGSLTVRIGEEFLYRG